MNNTSKNDYKKERCHKREDSMCQNSTLCNEKFVLEWCRWLHGPLFDKSLVLGPNSWCISKFESNCISRPPVPFGGHAAVQFLQRISNKLASSSTEVFCSLESSLLQVQFKSYLTRDHQFPDNMLHSHCYFHHIEVALTWCRRRKTEGGWYLSSTESL